MIRTRKKEAVTSNLSDVIKGAYHSLLYTTKNEELAEAASTIMNCIFCPAAGDCVKVKDSCSDHLFAFLDADK